MKQTFKELPCVSADTKFAVYQHISPTKNYLAHNNQGYGVCALEDKPTMFRNQNQTEVCESFCFGYAKNILVSFFHANLDIKTFQILKLTLILYIN